MKIKNFLFIFIFFHFFLSIFSEFKETNLLKCLIDYFNNREKKLKILFKNEELYLELNQEKNKFITFRENFKDSSKNEYNFNEFEDLLKIKALSFVDKAKEKSLTYKLVKSLIVLDYEKGNIKYHPDIKYKHDDCKEVKENGYCIDTVMDSLNIFFKGLNLDEIFLKIF